MIIYIGFCIVFLTGFLTCLYILHSYFLKDYVTAYVSKKGGYRWGLLTKTQQNKIVSNICKFIEDSI